MIQKELPISSAFSEISGLVSLTETENVGIILSIHYFTSVKILQFRSLLGDDFSSIEQ